jgi:hypothetical protein
MTLVIRTGRKNTNYEAPVMQFPSASSYFLYFCPTVTYITHLKKDNIFKKKGFNSAILYSEKSR